MPRIMLPSSLLPSFLRLRAQVLASALPAARRAERVPRVALHADLFEEEPLLRLGEPRHGKDGTRFQYLSETPRYLHIFMTTGSNPKTCGMASVSDFGRERGRLRVFEGLGATHRGPHFLVERSSSKSYRTNPARGSSHSSVVRKRR